MSRPGACEAGCAEQKLLLIRTATVHALTCAEATIRASIEAVRPIVEELGNTAPPSGGWEAGYHLLRVRARAALAHPPVDKLTAAYVLEEPAEPVVAWWCSRCGGLDAPQPCLGICVWRPVEWEPYDVYADLRERVISAYETERQLRSLVWRVAHTSPRPREHRRTWLAFAEEAANASRKLRTSTP